jgi:hypothetical protein
LLGTAVLAQGRGATPKMGEARVPGSAAETVVLGNAILPLTGPWKFHMGDSPAWANTGFDDSGWSAMDLSPSEGAVDPGLGTAGYVPGWTAKGHSGEAGFAWYRLRVQVKGDARSLALLMPTDVDDAYQVYCNGQLLGGFGDFSSSPPRIYYGQPMEFPLSSACAGNDLLLALRFYMRPADLMEDPTSGGPHSPPQLGLASVVASYYHLQRNALTGTYRFYFLPILGYLLTGLAAITLFLLDRKERVFLWLGAAALLNVLYMAFVLAAILTTFVSDRFVVLRPMLFSVVLWAWLMAEYSWFELDKQRWLRRTIYGLTALQIALQTALGTILGRGMNQPLVTGPWDVANNAVGMLLGAVLLVVLYFGWRQQPLEGRWAAPAVAMLLLALFHRPLDWLHVPQVWFVSGVQISTRLALEMLFSMWLSLLLMRRFQMSQRQQQQMQIEMRQAHQVQITMLQGHTEVLPGFQIESIYSPAAEVGGDFFQVLPQSNGGLLIVVGDVSGKGLRAAMLVSLIIGKLCILAEQGPSPGKLLQSMNQRLHKRVEGGFVTCLCAWIGQDGTVVLANAGHPSPYLDGEELETPGGLPLGLDPETEYAERAFMLPQGGRLVFVTDGVIEARNNNGELHGFDRTKALARLSAKEIARAAQNFGQEDDITVVALLREKTPGRTSPYGAETATPAENFS